MVFKLINKYTRRKICMTLIGPVVTYGCKTWTLYRTYNLLIFERQMLRKIDGPIHCKEGQRIRSNNELQKLIKGEDIAKYIQPQKIKWWGCVNKWRI
jgi:hypothetical protein